MSDWWQEVEQALQERSEGAPDPWADLAVGHGDVALTPEQRAFLEQLAAQPDPGRFADD